MSGILPAINWGNISNYSLEETIIGTWIDGKPLYQKTIDFGALPNKATKTVNHNISNLKYYINVWGYCQDSNGTGGFMPFACATPNGNMNFIGLWSVDNKSISISTGFDRSSFFAYVHILYTKTTD